MGMSTHSVVTRFRHCNGSGGILITLFTLIVVPTIEGTLAISSDSVRSQKALQKYTSEFWDRFTILLALSSGSSRNLPLVHMDDVVLANLPRSE